MKNESEISQIDKNRGELILMEIGSPCLLCRKDWGQDFVEEKLYGARPKMLITRYVTVLNNYPVEKALSNVKCEPGISSCGQLGRACGIGMQLEVICAVERG